MQLENSDHVNAAFTRRRLLGGVLAGAGAAAVGLPVLAGTRPAAAASWQEHAFPYTNNITLQQILTGVYATSPTNAWAVGSFSVRTKVGRWNGSSWTVVNTPEIGGASAIDGTSANDLWVAGLSGILHGDGNSWTTTPLPTPPPDFLQGGFADVVTGNTGNVWAYGRLNYIYGESPSYWVVRWDGRQWVVVPGVPVNVELRGITVAGASGAWIIGSQPNPTRTLVWQWNGSSWTQHLPPVDAGNYLHAEDVVALASNDVWVSGREIASDGSGSSRVYLARWNGQQWTRVALPAGHSALGLYAVNGTILINSGPNGVLLRENGQWTRLPAVQKAVKDFAGIPGGGIWVVGTQPQPEVGNPFPFTATLER